MDTLFSVVQAKVDTDLRFTLMAGSLYRHLSRTRGNRHWPCGTRQISNHILLTDATIRICQSCIEVLLGRRANPALLAAGLQAARAATRRSDHAKALDSLRELDQNPRNESTRRESQSPSVEPFILRRIQMTNDRVCQQPEQLRAPRGSGLDVIRAELVASCAY